MPAGVEYEESLSRPHMAMRRGAHPEEGGGREGGGGRGREDTVAGAVAGPRQAFTWHARQAGGWVNPALG